MAKFKIPKGARFDLDAVFAAGERRKAQDEARAARLAPSWNEIFPERVAAQRANHTIEERVLLALDVPRTGSALVEQTGYGIYSVRGAIYRMRQAGWIYRRMTRQNRMWRRAWKTRGARLARPPEECVYSLSARGEKARAFLAADPTRTLLEVQEHVGTMIADQRRRPTVVRKLLRQVF